MAAKDEGEWVDLPESEEDWVDEVPAAPMAEDDWGRKFDDQYEASKQGRIETLGRGLLQGATRDFAPRITAGIQAGLGQGDYEDNLRRQTEKFKRAEEDSPKLYNTGYFGGALGTAPVTMNPVASGAVGFIEGAARTLGQSSEINSKALGEAAKNGVMDATMAALFTKYGPAAFQMLGKAVKPVSDYARGVAGRQAVSAMKPTQGMVKDLQNKGLTEDLGNWALDNDVVTAFKSQQGMDEAAWKATADYANKTKPIYDAASKKTISNEALKSEILRTANEIQKNPANVKMGKKVAGFADDLDTSAALNAVGPAGPNAAQYNPSQLKAIRQALQEKINFKKPNNRGANDELRKIVREKEMGLIESLDPKLRQRNEELFRNIRLGNEAEKITERGAAQSAANNWIGLRGSMLGGMGGNAVGMMTGDPLTGAAAGAAIGGLIEIGRRYGNQWLAVNARRIANASNSDTYLPLFEQAAKRGGSAVSALHAQLMDEDPSYRNEFEKK